MRFMYPKIILCAVVGICSSFSPAKKKGPLKRKNFTTHNASLSNPTPTHLPPSPYHVLIDKSDFELRVYDDDGWLATYPVVFGSKDQEDKKMEGDRLTPEGTFKIVSKNPKSQWGKFMLLDYPTNDSYRKFNERKASGEIPKSAHIGSAIGIHGTRPNEEWVIDKFINWTSGCISVKYSDIQELYDLLPIGTEVVIQK